MKWLRDNLATVVRAITLVVAIGGSALGFFVSIKTDVAVLQADVREMKTNISATSRKLDRLYDIFVPAPFVASREKL